MKRLTWMLVIVFGVTAAIPAAADTRLIVRDTLGATALNLTCSLLGCQVQYGLGDPKSQLFLVTVPSLLNPVVVIANMLLQPGITGVELDQTTHVQAATAGAIPPALNDQSPINYYGTSVWHGYVYQPANSIVRTLSTQSTYKATGKGVIVAVIDTGVDPTHPVLKPVLLSGYDFVHNQSGANEKGDVSQSTAAVLDGAQPAYVSQSTAAVLDQSTAAVLDTNQYSDFGHGTMTAGIVHLVAPQAQILPLKAFQANGSGYASDVLRAIYYATKNGARVINMSFTFTTYSPELNNAINYANGNNVVCVAAAGNDGVQETVYPAALSNQVMGVASTTNNDTRSTFSNYGTNIVFVAAPGEGVVTTYPWGTYAAGWGTSFSTPFVAGSAALLAGVASDNQSSGSSAVAHAVFIESDLNHGRLDTYQAMQAWRAALGLK